VTFLRDHWRAVAELLALLAFAAALWLLRRPAPVEVRWLEHTRFEERVVKSEAGRVEQGPVRITTRWLVPPKEKGEPPAEGSPAVRSAVHDQRREGPTLPPGAVLVEQVEERGPAITTWRTDEARVTTADVQRELTEKPLPPRVWAAALGLQLSPDRALVVGLGHRLFGPVWVEGWLAPRLELRAPAAGVGVRIEF
jgi:hypothetical protein